MQLRIVPVSLVTGPLAALSVFVFQCANTDLHALTLYRSGKNLPAEGM
jgi:hypothetical protein